MVIPNQNSHNNNPTSSPVSAASTPSASPRIVIPSEAAAILQSLLQENNIMPQTTYPNNTFNIDFCLYEDESPFDCPLFDNTKLQSNHHLLSLHQNHTLHYQQSHQNQHQHLQPQQPQPVQNINSNPLCTPQTPSLDLLENERVMEPIGFDGFFLEESFSDHGSASAPVTLIHVNAMTSHFGSENVDGAGPLDLASSHANTVLVGTPFTPYLGTPFETPYHGAVDIGDSFGSNQSLFADRVAENLDCQERGSCIGSGFSSIPPFPEYGFDITAASLVDIAPRHNHCNNFDTTIEPATLFMASPVVKEESDYSRDSDSLSDCSSGNSSSTSEGGSPYRELGSRSDHAEDFDSSFDNEVEEEVESIKDCRYIKEEDDEDDEDDLKEEDDDDEYVPSRSLAFATSSSSSRKRKAPSTNNYGRNSVSTNNKASATSFKRTRPELASPYGGKKRSPKKKTSAVKRFPCRHDGCELRFARLYNLHTHERTHDPDQVRPFICSTSHCKKAFSRKHDLARHEASVHKGERNFKCHTCNKPFSRQDGLRRHLTVKSSECAVGRPNVQALAGDQNKPRWRTT